MDNFINTLLNLNWLEIFSVSGSSFLLIFAAEMGDKSQLVCIALAARYRAAPVILGAVLAFSLLNTLAVIFGATIANLLPHLYVSLIVAVLFSIFGIHALRIKPHENDETAVIRSNSSILFGTFLLLIIAEFADKTQLAIVALSSTSIPIAVWLGSTIALVTTSGLGVWAGRTLLQRIPITLLHRFSGIVFIALAFFAAYQSYLLF